MSFYEPRQERQHAKFIEHASMPSTQTRQARNTRKTHQHAIYPTLPSYMIWSRSPYFIYIT